MGAKSELPAEFQNQKILKFAESADSAKHTLRGIPQGELDSLRKKIAQANGKVVILVHPYYTFASNSSYRPTIEKLLRRSKAPVIIIEESHGIQLLKEKLAKLKAPNHMIIASSEGRSDIWLGVPPSARATGYLDTTHEAFAKFLQGVGAKTVLVGGMLAELSSHGFVREYEMSRLPYQPKKAAEARKESYTEGPLSSGCAGAIYRDLIKSGNFEVRWLPKAIDLPHRYVSPYPHPSLRRRPARGRMRK